MGNGIYRTSLAMATSPILITRSTMVLSVEGNKEKVSTSFIARFSNGTEKVLNLTKWMPLGLRREADKEDVVLDKNVCSLYWKDWSKNPVLGRWEENYPPPIVGDFIASLLPVNSILGNFNK